MTKDEYITEENLQTSRDRLSKKTTAFVEECVALKPEANSFFKKMADNIIHSASYSYSPEIINYIKLDDLKNYLLEYCENFYEANTNRNEYVFTLMKLGEKYKSKEEIPREIKEDLERMERESGTVLKKYKINGLNERISDMFKSASCLYMADEIRKEGAAVKEMFTGLTDNIDKEIEKLSGSLEDVVFELRRLQHEYDKAGNALMKAGEEC